MGVKEILAKAAKELEAIGESAIAASLTSGMPVVAELLTYVIGKLPIHVHNGPKSGKWECNSPYCNDMEVDRPEHGGPAVIHPPFSPTNPPPSK